MSDFINTRSNDLGPASGGNPEQIQSSTGEGYDQMTKSSTDAGMGGGQGVHGSGVAGGYQGSGNTQEKQDWLDKGLESVGKKAGFNLSDANADKIGDFANKQFSERAGRKLPGVQ
ncbi:hypothetical protein BDY19DRAFT_997216 [Irpex rosettiformis]|uniref:Uncharacterized protein n=1 Tax=Irpex rosettiformis TaxID=378272 RepID=A0ACB8TSF5_9APHY|nr:hypothetical protein BDY19DRAFT_997216 [Irpex rosettiformis]